MKLYGDISKTEEQDDGTVKVWGYASSAAVDSDGEQVTANAMRNALPEYMKFANVREMHTNKAAGIAIEASVQEDGRTFFGAHIIDTEAVKKVRAGVYKGFSIGGKVTSRDTVNKSIINGLRLAEVSLVDRPANPEATFTFFKMDGLEGQGDEVIEKAEVAPAEATPEVAEATDNTEDVTLKLNKADAEFIKALDSAGIARLQKFMADEAAAAHAAVLKGMGNIAQLAYTLKQLQYIVADQAAEAAREGDGSTVPEQLRKVAETLSEILIAMTKEECAELMANIAPPEAMALSPDADMVAFAACFTDLAKADLVAKAGAKFSASTKDVLGKAHGAMKEACSHLDSTGYAGKADAANDLAKAALSDDLAKMTGERDTLAKRVKELEALPAPTKGVLKVVEKSQDVIDETAGKAAREDKPLTDVDVMKGIHSRPLVMTASGTRPLN